MTDADAGRAQVAHTQAVLRQAQRVLRFVTDAETGERGYLLTGERDYLAPYERAVRDLPAEVQRLRDMTADDSAHNGVWSARAPSSTAKSQNCSRRS